MKNEKHSKNAEKESKMEFNLNAAMEKAMKTYGESVAQETTKYLSAEYGFSEEEALKKVMCNAVTKKKVKAAKKGKESVVAAVTQIEVEQAQAPKVEYIIQTDRSALTRQPYANKALIDKCIEEINGKFIHRPPIKVFKATEQPRNVAFFSNESKGYGYSKQFMAAQPLTPALKEFIDDVNQLFGSDFNGVLANEYEDGLKKIGAHSDNENGLSIIGGVVAISWGAVRNFRIRSKSNKKIVANVPTTAYELIRMSGKFQEEFTHEIPEEPKITEKRISLTLRKHTE